jgi:superoxide dismutase, Cu-Zn family
MKLIELTAGLVLVASLACEEKQQTPLNRQTPADRSGAVGSADPSRTGQLLPPGTVFLRAKGKLEAKEGAPVGGDVKLEEVTSGVRIEVSINDAPKNAKLGVVVHESGDCKDLAKGLGPHFNPRGTRHGLPGAPEQHAGDLGNLTTDDDGKGKLLILTSGGNLKDGDPKSYLHKPLVIHSKEDRGTEPSGDAGDPLACARIERD